MTLTIDLNPQEEARLMEAARQEGVDPSIYAHRLVAQLLWQEAATDVSGAGKDKSVAELMEEIGFASFEPTDIGARAEHYLRGFGEEKSATGIDQ